MSLKQGQKSEIEHTRTQREARTFSQGMFSVRVSLQRPFVSFGGKSLSTSQCLLLLCWNVSDLSSGSSVSAPQQGCLARRPPSRGALLGGPQTGVASVEVVGSEKWKEWEWKGWEWKGWGVVRILKDFFVVLHKLNVFLCLQSFLLFVALAETH